MKTLYELAELLRDIEKGIKHQCSVYARAREEGIEIAILFTRSLDRKNFDLHQLWTWQGMYDTPDDRALIEPFIHAANEFIRRRYKELTDDVTKYIRQ